MTPILKAYAKTKGSGVEWLGTMPEHWDVLPNRAVFSEINDRGHAEEQMLAVTISRGVIPQQELLEDSSKKDSSRLDRSNYKLVQPGDIAYNKMRAWQGALGVSDYRGIISPAYVVQRPRRNALAGYLHYLLRTPAFAKEAERWSYGITSDMWSLRPEHFKMIYSPVPPLPEQTAIARFLDHIDGRIQRYIRAKERLIALLEEYKQGLIHQAVTNGPDSKPTVISTGSTWFPKVPMGWKVLPMRRVIQSAIDGPHHSPNYVDQGIPFLSARNIKANSWSLGDVKYIAPNDYQTFCQRVKPEIGDVLYTKGGTTGIARVVDLDYPFQVWVHVAVLKVRISLIVPDYLALALNSLRCYEQSQLFTRGATNQDLGLGRMKNIVLPVPSLAVQKEIVAHVNLVEESTSSGIHGAMRLIQLLRECRTRLISDVVTGKLDVREAAAALPEIDPLEAESGAPVLLSKNEVQSLD